MKTTALNETEKITGVLFLSLVKKSSTCPHGSLEDSAIEMVFVEVAGENIDGLILLQERWHNSIQIQPVVEYQNGLFCFQHKAAMEDVG